jgi:TM2 domain-containing membrane protein YozV
MTQGSSEASSKKLAAGLCGIFLGYLGVHKFILGYTTEGIILLVLSLTCCGLFVTPIIGLIEGIIYLTKTDDEFYNTYIANKKGWF